jgi:hypothetical protein
MREEESVPAVWIEHPVSVPKKVDAEVLACDLETWQLTFV